MQVVIWDSKSVFLLLLLLWRWSISGYPRLLGSINCTVFMMSVTVSILTSCTSWHSMISQLHASERTSFVYFCIWQMFFVSKVMRELLAWLIWRKPYLMMEQKTSENVSTWTKSPRYTDTITYCSTSILKEIKRRRFHFHFVDGKVGSNSNSYG